MDKEEFYLLIPGIIYGVAIVDLLKIFRQRKPYWELVLWGIYIFLSLIFMWTELFQKLPVMTGDPANFLLIIIQSVLFAQIVYVLTPEESNVNTRAYFLDNKRAFYLLILLAVGINFVIQFVVYDDERPSWVRPTLMGLLLVCAFYDKVWVRTAVWGVLSTVALLLIFG